MKSIFAKVRINPSLITLRWSDKGNICQSTFCYCAALVGQGNRSDGADLAFATNAAFFPIGKQHNISHSPSFLIPWINCLFFIILIKDNRCPMGITPVNKNPVWCTFQNYMKTRELIALKKAQKLFGVDWFVHAIHLPLSLRAPESHFRFVPNSNNLCWTVFKKGYSF